MPQSQMTVPDQASAIRPLLINAPIPSITLPTTDGTPVDINQAVQQHATILLFYRGGW